MLPNGIDNGGFGMISQDEYEVLRKALDSGYDVGGTSQTGGGAWRLESLEDSLTSLTHAERHIVFYNDIPKGPATSTAIEYARRTDLGDESGGFYSSGELPISHDATYDRKVALVKFLGDVREVKMPFLLTSTLVDQRTEMTRTGTMWLLRLAEKSLFRGNAKLGLAGAEFEEYDGLETFIERDASVSNTMNKWGDPLDEDDFRNAGQRVVDAYGIATHVYVPSQILEDYNMAYLKTQTLPLTQTPGGNMTAGFSIDKLKTVAGEYQFRPTFLYGGMTREIPKTTVPSNAPSPALASVVGALTGAPATATWYQALKMVSAASAGTVTYKVSVANRYGESAVATSAGVAVAYAARDQNITVTLTNPAAYVNAPTHACIYRNDTYADGTSSGYYLVKRISLTSVAGAGTLAWADTGSDMPGTYRAFQGQLSPDVLKLKQLLPFTRIPLPPLSLSERFALVMFHVPIMKIPDRWVMIKNIGRRTL